MSNDQSLDPSIQISLIDHPETVYELYDFVNGILTLELNRSLSSKFILIKFKAIGEVQWLIPQYQSEDNQQDEFLKERENFLNTNYNIEKNYKPLLESGLHKIPFQFQLNDKKLPPSFEENNGFICYYITASIRDDETNKLLIKTAPLYLKNVRISLCRNDLSLAIGDNKTLTFKSFRNFCFQKKSKVQVYVYLSKKGYVIGEQVPIEIHIINNSAHKVNSTIKLLQTKCFFCKNRQHIVEHQFEEISGPSILKGEDVKQTITCLKIPDCIVSFKTNIIIVSYFIHLSLSITKSVDLHLNLPIIITTKRV